MGADAANDEFDDSCTGPDTDMGGPLSAEASWVAPARSSPGQYATGIREPVNRTFARYSAELSGCWVPPRRRSSPAAVRVTDTSRPDTSHACGHDATSPWSRYLRLLISPVPLRVHVFDSASVKLVAPAVWAVKSGPAFSVPAMPDSHRNAWIFPYTPGLLKSVSPEFQPALSAAVELNSDVDPATTVAPSCVHDAEARFPAGAV